MIFLDNQASTAEAIEVIEAVAKASRDLYANPHSEHAFGRRAEVAVDKARESIAELIGCDPEEIVFTSGASESNNIALQGTALSLSERPIRFVTTTIEHKCVHATCAALESRGVKIEYCPVTKDGLLDPEEFVRCLNSNTSLVSVMLVNNEVGVIQDLQSLSESVHGGMTLVHSDIAQAVGKIPVDVVKLGLHMASLSAHKMHGPKGIGALYIAKDAPIRPKPIYYGGGQELGLRPGTLPVPLCVGFGVAAELALCFLREGHDRITFIRDLFLSRIREGIPSVEVIGNLEHRVPHNLNLRIPGISADRMVGALQPTVAISTGSACAAGEMQPSHVLRALGLGPVEASECVRIGFSRYTTDTEVLQAALLISESATRISNNSR